MERLTKRVDGIAVLESWAVDKDPVSVVQRLCSALAAYEDTGLEPEQVMELKSFTQGGIHKVDDGWKHVQDLLKAEQDGRLFELPFVAMVEQSLQDGKMKPMGDQKHNGRYAVVYAADVSRQSRPSNGIRSTCRIRGSARVRKENSKSKRAVSKGKRSREWKELNMLTG